MFNQDLVCPGTDDLRDSQWSILDPLIPEPKGGPDGRGFAPAQKGGSKWAKPSSARRSRSLQWQTAAIFVSLYTQLMVRRRSDAGDGNAGRMLPVRGPCDSLARPLPNPIR